MPKKLSKPGTPAENSQLLYVPFMWSTEDGSWDQGHILLSGITALESIEAIQAVMAQIKERLKLPDGAKITPFQPWLVRGSLASINAPQGTPPEVAEEVAAIAKQAVADAEV
jgi:hypothetical protein